MMTKNPGLAGSRGTAALLLAIVAVAISLVAVVRQRNLHDSTANASSQGQGLLERIEKTNEIHAGYGVYPPYTQEDPASGKVTGFSIDVLQQIAHDLNAKLVLHRLNWNTMSADLKRGSYDLIADPIFETIPRAREFSFTQPYAYFPDGIAVVRKQEQRFTDFESLDRTGIRIAVGQGWASETLLRTRFTHASLEPVQTATDLLQVFNEVVSGRADVAVSDGADAERFAKEHPKDVKVLFLDHPPAYMPAGFALRPSDREGAEFLTVCLRNLDSTGVLDGLAKRYGVTIRAPLNDRR